MKRIRKYKQFILERNSESGINYILDKISKYGIDSISQIERKILDNSNNFNFNVKEDIINDIKYKVEKHGGILSMGEMGAEASPLYKDINQQIHLIEKLSFESVTVVVYGGYKYETHLNEYDVDYNELEIETLSEIKEIIDKAIKFEYLFIYPE